jgi:hypothetical protein
VIQIQLESIAYQEVASSQQQTTTTQQDNNNNAKVSAFSTNQNEGKYGKNGAL